MNMRNPARPGELFSGWLDDLGCHRHRLPTFDQAHRLKPEFQGVFAPGLSVFSLAHFEISNA